MSAGDLLGYLDAWSVLPGETVTCRVSCTPGDDYAASLVRVVQGDTHPDAPGFCEENIALDLGGPFPARHQPIETGSMAIVDPAPSLRVGDAFTVVVDAWPTLPGRGRQCLVSRMDASGNGFELTLDERGVLTAVSTMRGETVELAAGDPLRRRGWYRVWISHDAAAGRLAIGRKPLGHHCGFDVGARASVDVVTGDSPFNVSAPLVLAARSGQDRAHRCHFNGRLHEPFVVAGCVDGEAGAMSRVDRSVAAWDFTREIGSDRIVDVSGNGHHGRLVNLPTRGVTGPDWDGTCHAWPHDARHYGAIHFHDDDLYDAGWDESFRFRLPHDLPSGVYAVRLARGDDRFYLPFGVRAPRRRRGSAVAYLMPTASYMAYANNRIGLDVPETELVCGRLIELTAEDRFMQAHPELGLSFYDLHNDGSAVYYSSRRRPIMDFQPGFVGKLGGLPSNVWQFNADTHITGWLASSGTPFDVVTDEDLQREGADALAGYRVLVTGSHPEYYSAGMRDALDGFIDRGGRLMYLGGNGFYWRVSFHPDLPGVIECRKSEDGIRAVAPGPGEYYASFTGEYTGLWRRNGRPPNELAGVGMVAQGFDASSPYRRTAASHDPRVAFMFEGIDAETIGHDGLSGGGAAGIELDAANAALGTPRHALVVASSEQHSDVYLVTPEDMLDPVPGLGGSESELVRSDMVFFETPAGGAVFSVGSIAWAGSMAWNGYDNDVARLTRNVLERFLDETSFEAPANP